MYCNDDRWKNNVIDGSWGHDAITGCKSKFVEVYNVNPLKVQIEETVTDFFF